MGVLSILKQLKTMSDAPHEGVFSREDTSNKLKRLFTTYNWAQRNAGGKD